MAQRPKKSRDGASGKGSGAGRIPVVAIGASAGGLEAFGKFFDAMPPDSGMAFILIQHLDPHHRSLMAELLSRHTPMTVLDAKDGMAIEAGHIYVIPPGVYLALAGGTIALSKPSAPHGARLPFDFLLQSLAESHGPAAVCVILSGSGADGSLGVKAVRAKRGLVIAQDPEEADYDGMPRAAIASGAVDQVLPIAEIPAAIVNRHGIPGAAVSEHQPVDDDDHLADIVELLRVRTKHNFTLYKPGTLRRRIERRMVMASIAPGDDAAYLKSLHDDAEELGNLAKDLLIHVTSFFRDKDVFDLLSKKIVPEIIRKRTPDLPLRIWIAGCSTGEETYSLAMIFLEEIEKQDLHLKFQVFASDVDPDAVALAREGVYPETIKSDVSAARLDRFFIKEGRSFRVTPALREVVVFTVQDVLADPPFSRLDLVSCRNLLIYLRPEAQAQVISLFHFALRPDGLLVLGRSETTGNAEGRFEMIARTERIYRRIGGARLDVMGAARLEAGRPREPDRPQPAGERGRQAALAKICRDLVLETHAPAAVIINRDCECLFSMGPTHRYLHVPAGHQTYDLLAMIHPDARIKLRSAIQQARNDKARIVAAGAQIVRDGQRISFSIDVRPATFDGEDLLLVCFVATPAPPQRRRSKTGDTPRTIELENQLEAMRTELQGAILNLEISAQEQKAINEEALSVNEEFQSTNEELLTSKEELQSLNEELTALNSQLQEAFERQRTTSNDLQNVLYSTDVATIFLDPSLSIRFFTPATRKLFRVTDADIGRPLSDFTAMVADGALLEDATAMIRGHSVSEREVEGLGNTFFARRILPYRTMNGTEEGVVVTYTDITERKQTARLLEAAKFDAEAANTAKSRFLAAASHDLRQPLQTLALICGILAKIVEGERAQKLVALQDQTLGAMSGMLNTLLDINQIDAGAVRVKRRDFPVGNLLERLSEEFGYHATTQGLTLRVVQSTLIVHSDPLLLEQLLRNLVANALKYTAAGKVLLGCRRHETTVSFEVWDTGIGIPPDQLDQIFEEYHQVDNPARQRARGLGLGLSIVKRLADMLGHRIDVRSRPGQGSVFAVEVAQTPRAALRLVWDEAVSANTSMPAIHRTGSILVIEDDPEVRELLELVLRQDGQKVVGAADGHAGLALLQTKPHPDLILADYNLPDGLDGLQVIAKVRGIVGSDVPAIVLTGDISAATMGDVEMENCAKLDKPVKLDELLRTIQTMLPAAGVPESGSATS